jgi:DNA-binding IclR family transcriptional regulator
MSENQYLSNQICRVLKLTKQLSGYESTGLTVSELASKLEISPSQALRDLTNLKEEGFAERCPWDENRWRLGYALAQISNRVRLHLDQAQLQLQQDMTNYSKIV